MTGPIALSEVIPGLKAADAAFAMLNAPATRLAMWQQMAAIVAAAKTIEAEWRKACVEAYFPAADEGTSNYDLGKGYKLKVVNKYNYRMASNDTVMEALDTIEKLSPEGKFVADRLVKFDPRLSLIEYKALEPKSKIKEIIDGVLTITPGMPSLEIVEPKV